MTVKRLLAFLVVAAIMIGAVQFGTLGRPVPAPALPQVSETPSVAALTAIGMRLAALHEADRRFFVSISGALHGPASELGTAYDEAMAERQESLDLAEKQYAARLELVDDFGVAPYDPSIDPSEFSATVNNSWYTLVPGRTLVYEKETAEGLERIEVTTLGQTVEIDSVECRAVRSVETVAGELVERTTEWFAQNPAGDVWCFGELAMRYEDGFLDNLEGSWRAGKDGAKAGVRMPGMPVIGTICRAGFLIGEAEDLITVVSLNGTAVTAEGTYTGCVVIEEWSPLEPGERDQKYFAPGIGLVLEINLITGERLELVQITQH